MTLPRGFKTGAEREAVRIRRELGIVESGGLPLKRLADYLSVTIVSAETLVGRDRLEELEGLQAYAFSAATFEIAERTFIVTNPMRAAARTASDVAHEFSHIMLDHKLSEIREVEGTPFRTCRPDEEEQATAFGGTLLLPRPLLLKAVKLGWGAVEIADHYGVTNEMARFRLNTTGVVKQVQRRGR